ncbi:SDR family oxidoreductase [Streptomyces xinghaiensis]|uniref:SDR family oxidoreductase n=1 Tax=Streptomyces xinghaiensis TaxID=1038928 RepID=UPI000681F7AB|nr:NAD(P)H-binding protein [Streptomyces xinghaiensis]MZE78103.1 NAD(P)H-binding protein [Streptomyces sp. SID5475]
MEQSVLVTGGTGTLGRAVVQRLLDAAPAGARLTDGRPAVRVLSRRSRSAADDRPYDWATGDLRSGEGIDAAVTGADVVIHCATTLGRGDVEATRRLTDAVARQPDGSPHLVHISIVGIDRIPLGYYRAKLEAERIIESSQVPWTILRATQFHDLIARIASAQRRLPALAALAGVRFQPVDVTEVAARLVELADGFPAGRVPDLGGPEARAHTDLTRAWLRATGRRRAVLPLPLPGRAGRELRAGANLVVAGEDGGNTLGRITFEDFLAGRRPTGRNPERGQTGGE